MIEPARVWNCHAALINNDALRRIQILIPIAPTAQRGTTISPASGGARPKDHWLHDVRRRRQLSRGRSEAPGPYRLGPSWARSAALNRHRTLCDCEIGYTPQARSADASVSNSASNACTRYRARSASRGETAAAGSRSHSRSSYLAPSDPQILRSRSDLDHASPRCVRRRAPRLFASLNSQMPRRRRRCRITRTELRRGTRRERRSDSDGAR